MLTKEITWSVHMIQDRKTRINPKPQYQRTPVWSESKKQLLIDSLLRGYDVPKIYVRSTDGPFEHEVVDGQQRIRTIWSFLDDEFALGEESKDLPGPKKDLSAKFWSDLPTTVRDKLKDFPFSVVEILEATDLEVRDLFKRLQEGVPLNPVEKRNAMPRKMRDFIEDKGESHPALKLTNYPDKRFGHHDLAAHVTCLDAIRSQYHPGLGLGPTAGTHALVRLG